MQNDNPKPILFDGFEKAFMGMLRRYGEDVPIALYDYGHCMQILMDRDGMQEDDAIEWLEVNNLGAYLGESTPAMVFRCNLKEFKRECGIDEDQGGRDCGDEHTPEEEANDAMTKEEYRLFEDAIRNFAHNFMKYVREVDETLYIRAKQYASDYSGNAVIEFIDDDQKGSQK